MSDMPIAMPRLARIRASEDLSGAPVSLWRKIPSVRPAITSYHRQNLLRLSSFQSAALERALNGSNGSSGINHVKGVRR
jgi:hypothetical protein